MMMLLRTSKALALGLCLTASIGARAADPPPATIGNAPITQEELERAVGSRLMRIRTEEYNTKRAVLDELIAERLLAAEAARRKITADELLQAEVEKKIAEPDPAELETVYAGISDRFPGMTREEALAQMAAGMRRQRITARRTEFVDQLRAAAKVRVNLEPPRATVSTEGPSRGKETAPVTIVEFSDFECSFCSRVTATLKQLESKYGDKIRLVYRDYPLASHRTAKRAAEVARCAHDQGKFWEVHDLFLAKGGAPITDADIGRAVTQAALDKTQFDACVASGKYKEVWRASQEEGFRAGVNSTPSFFVNGRLIVGAAAYETFAKVIDEELARAGAR